MAKKILAWSDSAQQFYREIGKRQNGKAFRFYLGADQKQAAVASARLEALWAGVQKRWRDFTEEGVADSPFPCWDSVTLQLGKCIAKGQYTVELDVDEPPVETSVWVASLRTYFPMIHVSVAEGRKLRQGDQEMREMFAKLAEEEEQRHLRNLRVIKNEAELFDGKVRSQ